MWKVYVCVYHGYDHRLCAIVAPVLSPVVKYYVLAVSARRIPHILTPVETTISVKTIECILILDARSE